MKLRDLGDRAHFVTAESARCAGILTIQSLSLSPISRLNDRFVVDLSARRGAHVHYQEVPQAFLLTILSIGLRLIGP